MRISLDGGTALNIVPHECTFDFEFRHLPGDDPAKLLTEFKSYVAQTLEPEMRAVFKDAGFDIQLMSQIPALDNRATLQNGVRTKRMGAQPVQGCARCRVPRW